MRRQRGSGALAAVLLVLMMGSLLLGLSQRQQATRLALNGEEGRWQQAWLAAESALSWGLQLRWPEREGIHCRRPAAGGWRVCLLSPPGGGWLLRGEGGGKTHPVHHWRWVSWQHARLSALPGGWIDFCPLTPADACDADAG
ncbi:DUF2509 family protein [Pantoea sp. 1.19]|uniref:DUF2509 family protein n=1 Tax=Pantoea sp. 1.19 TaxID=1925589 RepID=UPI0009FA30FE|nr:DUF2509 family protein [Pantoea sp. 1.19]